MDECIALNPSPTTDKSFQRIVLLESFSIAILVYVCSSAILRGFDFDVLPYLTQLLPRWPFMTGARLLDPVGALQASVVPTLAIGALGYLMARMLLRKSARARKALIEFGVVMSVAAPALGFEFVETLNRKADTSPAMIHERVIDSKRALKWRVGSRGGRYWVYRLHFKPLADKASPRTPNGVSVDLDTYNAAEPGMRFEFLVREGYLNLPWFEESRLAGR